MTNVVMSARACGQRDGGRYGFHCFHCLPLHRPPPFFPLVLPCPMSHTKDISAFVGPNQCRFFVARHRYSRLARDVLVVFPSEVPYSEREVEFSPAAYGRGVAVGDARAVAPPVAEVALAAPLGS